jgi:hypothetical protein
MLDLLLGVDALRRPERLRAMIDACAADDCSRPGASQDYLPRAILEGALAVVKSVNAGAIARAVAKEASGERKDDAVASAVRAARLAALKKFRAGRQL